VLFYLIAGVTFFLPTALVSAELASSWPERGGVYIWVREALGNPIAFMVIWVQWIYNICWFPTILSLLAATLAYMFDPHWVDSKLYMLSVIFTIYWATTFVNMQGMRASGILSCTTALVGTLLPMLVIIGLGAWWWLDGKPSQIHFTWHNLWPTEDNMQNIMFFTNVVFGLAGIEMSAVHAQEVKNPQRDYPRALLFSSVIIFLGLTKSISCHSQYLHLSISVFVGGLFLFLL